MGNKGGRPPLEAGKRSFKIDVRFTEAEYRLVERMAGEAGLKKADLIRKRLLSGEGSLLNAGALLTALDKLSLELSRSGNNINQLARYANRLQKHGVLSPRVVADLLEVLGTHERHRSELAMLFRKMIRLAKG